MGFYLRCPWCSTVVCLHSVGTLPTTGFQTLPLYQEQKGDPMEAFKKPKDSDWAADEHPCPARGPRPRAQPDASGQ